MPIASFLALGFAGGYEWLIIGFVVLLIFGGRKLPELARSMGTSITQFKKGLKDNPELLDDASATGDESKKDGDES